LDGIVGAAGFGGVCGRIGNASPTSVCPRAFSTFGRLNKLNSDSLDAVRPSFCVGVADGVFETIDAERPSGSWTLVLDRVKRHRELDEESEVRLRMLRGFGLDVLSDDMFPGAAYI
jgi:hypothetical protein